MLVKHIYCEECICIYNFLLSTKAVEEQASPGIRRIDGFPIYPTITIRLQVNAAVVDERWSFGSAVAFEGNWCTWQSEYKHMSQHSTKGNNPPHLLWHWYVCGYVTQDWRIACVELQQRRTQIHHLRPNHVSAFDSPGEHTARTCEGTHGKWLGDRGGTRRRPLRPARSSW